MQKEIGQRAIWRGVTLDLGIGIIVGFSRHHFGITVLYALITGGDMGVFANVFGWIGDSIRQKSG